MQTTARHQTKKLPFLILVLFLACRSGSTPPQSPQTAFPPVSPTSPPPDLAASTSPGPRSIEPVPPDQTATATGQTDNEGIALFDDPLSGVLLEVEFLEESSLVPVPNLEVWFISNGPKALVIASDPNDAYAPIIKELAYEELVSNSTFGKRAAPTRELTLTAVLLMVKLIDLYQDIGDWLEFVSNFPSIEEWSIQELSLCVNPEQAQLGLSLFGKQVLNLLFLKFPHDDEIIEAMGVIFEELGEEGVDDIFKGFSHLDPPAIVRFTVYSFNSGLIPDVLFLDGYCLNPLNRTDPQSTLDWLLYGVEESDLYPFKILSHQDGVYYANYIEGGQSVSLQMFLSDLESRFTNGNTCLGHTKSDYYVQVWTESWSPPWKMTELCYIDCAPISPPYTSTDIGFFLRKSSDEWWLTTGYLNTPENYFYAENYELVSCDAPLASSSASNPAISTTVPVSSCPGAPPQRMVVDQRGYVCTQNDHVNLRSGPDRSNDLVLRLGPGAPIIVTGGPACANDWSWWKIRTDDGVVGWVSEGGDQVDPFFICPLP